MPHIYTSRFLKDIAYTETQFAEAFDYIFQKNIDYTIVGNDITIDSFGTFANGYFIIGVGSETVNVTQSGYLIIEYQRNETLNTEVFSSVYYSATIPTSTSVNKYGVLGEVVVDYSGALKFYPRVTKRLEDDTKRIDLLWSGVVVGGDPFPINLNDYPQYDHFVGYIGSPGRPITIRRYSNDTQVQGSCIGLFSEISGAGQTSYTFQMPTSGSTTIIKRLTHFFSGNHSSDGNASFAKIEGVKL